MRLLAHTLLAATLIAPAMADEKPTTGVDLKLVADTTAVVPGQPFIAALHIHHHKDFHTYWKAPGIVGLPTGLKWDLPDGFSASGLSWPAPEFTYMFHYLAYGYESDTLLLTTITPPKDLEPGTTVSLSTRVTWMACAATCHPGNRVFSLSLPVSSKASPDPTWAKKIAAARDAVPEPLGSLTSLSASLAGEIVTLNFTAPDTVILEKLHFVSDSNLFDPNTPQKLSVTDQTATLTLQLMPEAPKPLPQRLSGLLHNPAGWPSLDRDQFGRLDLPLASP